MKRNFSLYLVILIIFGVLLSASELWAKIYIDIRSPSFRKFPIAVAPFTALLAPHEDMKLGERATDILLNNLGLCGFFALIDVQTLAESLKRSGKGAISGGVPGGSIKSGVAPNDFHSWANIGAEALVVGEVSFRNRSLILEARLYDVVNKEMLIGKRYIGEITDLSRMVHRFADEVVFALTGEHSFFLTKVVFVSQATGNKEIYLMDFDGRNITQLTRHQSICLSPRFSPNGTKIAFTSYKAGNPDIYIRDLRTGDERRLVHFPGLNISPSFSPDGQRLAFTLSKDGNPEIYTMRVDGSDLTRLTYDPAIDVSPSWSPDGKRIAFVSNRGGHPQIYLMEANGQNIQRLTFEGNYNTHPAWSPRGDRIAFDSFTGDGTNICTIRSDGTGYKILTAKLGRCEMPSWSPGGSHIIFSSNRDGPNHLFLVDAEGTHIKKLTFLRGGDTYPNWSPRIKD